MVPLALLAAVVVMGWAQGRWVGRRAAELASAEERRFNFLFETLRCLQSLKLLGAERLLERRYERLQGSSAALRRRLCERVTPRSASRNTVALAFIGPPRSACRVSWPCGTRCLAMASCGSGLNSVAVSASAMHQPKRHGSAGIRPCRAMSRVAPPDASRREGGVAHEHVHGATP
jgi:hypothetical protein